MKELEDFLPIDNHDQGTFTISWNPYINARNSKTTINFLKMLRDEIKNYFEKKDKWKHGYWKIQEAHHGTEHFEIFLGNLWTLDPADSKTIKQMVDVAEHMGNWVEEIPKWFSWDKGLYYSFQFGTEQVKEKNYINMPDHFRCINISLFAYQMTTKQKYLNLAKCFANNWVNAILKNTSLPVALTEKGPIYSISDIKNEQISYKNFVGQVSDINSDIDRAENLLASGAIDTLLFLWKVTSEVKYRLSAEKLLNIISRTISDPDAGCGVDMIRKYRNLTNDYRYDNNILEHYKKLRPYSFKKISLESEINRDGRPSGIGKRSDKPCWYEDNSKAKNNPIFLSLVAEINNDTKLAIRALDIARTYFELAKDVFPHGHNHGCSARSVSAIASGHGRENKSGVVTAVLEPLMKRYNVYNI